jgi:cytochrome c-type biogenesis protein CcmF
VHYLGLISLYIACASTILAISAGVKPQKFGTQLAREANLLSVLTTALGTLALVVCFLTDNFRLAYVARNSERSLPAIYKISALWAGQSGSLLLWLFIISLMVLAIQSRGSFRKQGFDLQVNVVVNLVRLVFLILLIFVSSPFELLAEPPRSGQGLNPMLQSLGMVVHPPLLFLGFSGYLVPFAITVASLWKGEGEQWFEEVRSWALFAWLFLTAGIVTGGHWAYTELGWGGYWAWDPVENASLFPWLTGTALLHALHLDREHPGRKWGAYLLICLTFALTIFGTFLTRSGVLDSVHAFAGGALGPIFLVVLAIILLFSAGLGWARRERLQGQGTEEIFSLSLGTALQLGNLLLLLLFGAVFLGTMFPLLSRLAVGREIVLDESFFNQVTVPLFLVLFFLLGLAPVLPRSGEDLGPVFKRIWLPLLGGCAVALSVHFTRGAGAAACLAFGVAVFGLATHLQNMVLQEGRLRLGSSLVHIGILIMLIGITGSSVCTDSIFLTVEPGQEFQFGPYQVSYSGLTARYGVDRYTVGTTLDVARNHRKVRQLTSEKTFWEKRTQPSTEVGILSTLREDLYLNLAGWEGQTAQLHLQRFALLSWIWFGSGVVYLGAVLSLISSRVESKASKQVKVWR